MFLKMIADKVLGAEIPGTGERGGDPTGIASAIANMGDGMLSVASMPKMSQMGLDAISANMKQFVSGGESANDPSYGHALPAVERVASAFELSKR